MTEVTTNLKKGSFKKAFASVLAACLVLTLIPFAGQSVQGSVLNGILASTGCVTDGNASAKKALTTSGNGTYFHTYGAPTFTWSADGTSCKATFVCEKGDDTLVADCNITTTVKTAATTSKTGTAVNTATVKVYEATYTSTKNVTIPKISKVTLSKTDYNYTGKVKTPKVTVKDSNGKTISASNYSLSYSDNKKVGTGSVTITFDGKMYSGSVTKEFTIAPRATTLKTVSATTKGFKATWSKKTTQVTGYQIRYSTSSKFTSGTTKTVTISKNSTTSKTVSNLKAKKKYYVQVRTYKTVDGTTYYSTWSDALSVTTK